MSEFHIDATIQSQYSASKHICKLVNAFWESINPEADIELIYNKMINPLTAEGVGLDVWGRIVAIGRNLVALDEKQPYLGFNTTTSDVVNERLDSFNNTAFYSKINGLFRLNDNGYRTYIFIKAMINIGNSSLADLNKMIHVLFPTDDIKILHSSTMVLRVLILSQLSDMAKQALLTLPWLPAGVGLEMYQVVTPTLGFDGSELNPFDQGTFATYETKDIEAV